MSRFHRASEKSLPALISMASTSSDTERNHRMNLASKSLADCVSWLASTGWLYIPSSLGLSSFLGVLPDASTSSTTF